MNNIINNKYKNESGITLSRLQEMYFERCLNRVIRLFIYEGLPFPAHEIEYRAVLDGFAGVVRDKKRGIMTAWGGMSGVTQYEDIFKRFTYAAPTAEGGTVDIGTDCVILRNTPTMTSMFTWLMRYADLYAHNDISLRMALINSRYQDILSTTDAAKADTIKDWHTSLEVGKLVAIIDDMPMSEFKTDGNIKALDINRQRDVDFTKYTELENELTRTFYRDIGVRWNKDKKANLVAGEVEQDNMLLEFNISDMLNSRKEFCDNYNKVFGGNVKVSLATPLEETNYDTNNDDSKISGDNDGRDTVFRDDDNA